LVQSHKKHFSSISSEGDYQQNIISFSISLGIPTRWGWTSLLLFLVSIYLQQTSPFSYYMMRSRRN